jgi:hypothetical protein
MTRMFKMFKVCRNCVDDLQNLSLSGRKEKLSTYVRIPITCELIPRCFDQPKRYIVPYKMVNCTGCKVADHACDGVLVRVPLEGEE